jgi:ATP-dependent protease Clp ATPase subunit
MGEVGKIELTLRCCFCFRDSGQVRKLIMGSFVGICNDCVGECVRVIGESMEPKSTGG